MKKYFSVIGIILATLALITFCLFISLHLSSESRDSNTFAQVILGGIVGFPFLFPAFLSGFGFVNNVIPGIVNTLTFYFIGLLFQKLYNNPQSKWIGLILPALYIAGFISFILFMLLIP